jgi:hypothetical protein
MEHSVILVCTALDRNPIGRAHGRGRCPCPPNAYNSRSARKGLTTWTLGMSPQDRTAVAGARYSVWPRIRALVGADRQRARKNGDVECPFILEQHFIGAFCSKVMGPLPTLLFSPPTVCLTRKPCLVDVQKQATHLAVTTASLPPYAILRLTEN